MKRTIIITAVLFLAAICLPFLWQKSPDNPPPAFPPADTTVTYSFSTPEEYMAECRRLSDIFWETLNTETRQKWYELSVEASKHFPDNPKIMGDFAIISRFNQFSKSPVECLGVLQPFYDNSETYADIAYGVWSQFNYGITNKHNLEYDNWNTILKGCGDPLETLKIMETYWAQRIPNATSTLKSNSHPQLILEAAQRDIDMEDAERRWQIIKANLAAYMEKQEELKNFLSMPNPPALPPPPQPKKTLIRRLKDWLKFKPRLKIVP